MTEAQAADLLLRLSALASQPLHDFAIFHVRTRPLFRSLEGCTDADLALLQDLAEYLQLPQGAGDQAEAGARRRSSTGHRGRGVGARCAGEERRAVRAANTSYGTLAARALHRGDLLVQALALARATDAMRQILGPRWCTHSGSIRRSVWDAVPRRCSHKRGRLGRPHAPPLDHALSLEPVPAGSRDSRPRTPHRRPPRAA
jgi:hypothetical protein